MLSPAHAGSQAADQVQSGEVDAEAQSGVHMACVFQAGKMGIAAYDTFSAEVVHPPPSPATTFAHRDVHHHTYSHMDA